jgi:hypothetical protein
MSCKFKSYFPFQYMGYSGFMRTFIVLLLVLLTTVAEAGREERIGIEKIRVLMAHGGMGGHIPGSDMSKRFGSGAIAGGGFMYKTRSNWIFNVDYNFLFGGRVKENVLENITTSRGFPIDNTGRLSEVEPQQRGHIASLQAGYIFDIIGPNVNSGIYLMAGPVFIQHEIHLYYSGQRRFPQIDGDYGAGYDRLTYGPGIRQTIGYFHFNSRNLLNFYIGLDFIQGFTYNRRSYNFDEMKAENELRIDLLTGIRGGIFFPFFSRFWE